jgi:uncharacterized membrane protein
MTPAPSSTNDPSLPAASRGWLLAAMICFVVALVIVAPFFWWGSASGHDFEFHLQSWLDVAGQWKEGILFPRWTEWANHGFGEPRFIFYPPLSWLLGPALSAIVPWNYVPVAFIVLVQTLAGISAFVFARCLLPERASIFAAVCYTANPNALLIIYMRSDYAELLASAFFPLLFLTALQLGNILENRDISKSRQSLLFALVFGAVWLSNAPAGVMATYSVVLLFAWMAIAERSWKPLLHGAGSVALGFGLAGVYLVPAAYEQRWVNIGQVLSNGLLPSQNFLYTEINDPEHTLFNWIASSAAILTIVITGIAAIVVHRQEAERETHSTEKKVWRALLLLAVVGTVMMLRLSSVWWQILPKLKFVQFPWRWMSILALTFAYFLAAAVAKQRVRWVWVAAVLAVLAGTATFLVLHTWWDADDIATIQAGIANGSGFDGTDEYDPAGDDHYNLPAKAPRAWLVTAKGSSPPIEPRVTYNRWTARQKDLQVTVETPTRLALRLLNYPAWHVDVNRSAVLPESGPDSGYMVVELPAGQSRITARFRRTPDRTLGGLLSLLSAIAALLVALRQAPTGDRRWDGGRPGLGQCR